MLDENGKNAVLLDENWKNTVLLDVNGEMECICCPSHVARWFDLK